MDQSFDVVAEIYKARRDPAKAAEQIEAWLRRLSLATLVDCLEMEIGRRQTGLGT